MSIKKQRKVLGERAAFKKFLRKRKAQKIRDIKILGIPEIKAEEKSSYKKFLKGRYWSYVKNLVYKRDGKLCSRCPSSTYLQIHHTTYNNHFNEHNHLEDLIILCKDCHEKEHNIN